jgi:hypothetical protein
MSTQIPQNSVGILAYGSLIDEPGPEIEPYVIARIPCQTPFAVEYGRLSESRDYAPTVIPMKEGSPVSAVILVLDPAISPADAASRLWRRETRKIGTGRAYQRPEKIKQNTVTVEEVNDFHGVTTVLYTQIAPNMGVFHSVENLAGFAIKSAVGEAGEDGKDGITYLADNIKNGIHTPLTDGYVAQILAQTDTKSLEEATAKLAKFRPARLKNKAEWKAFEKDVRSIADFIFEYGLNTTMGPDWPEDGDWQAHLKENYSQFVVNCHTGFKKAQDLALQLLLDLQDNAHKNKEALKLARSNKEKDWVIRLLGEKKELEFKDKVVRHLMDGLAWQITGGQLYVSRQLYKEVEDTRTLRSSNIESLQRVAAELNAVPEDFAMITDLTSYVQIGDLILKKPGSITLVEVKEGDKNLAHINIIEELLSTEITPDEIVKKHALTEKDMEQIDRQFRQMLEMENFGNIVNHDKGRILKTGQEFKIITPDEPTPYYRDRLAKLYDQLKERNLLGYDVIDKCLHIGLYKGPFREKGPIMLKSLAEQKNAKYIIINYLQVLDSLNRPLFDLPFPKDFIFDILFSRVLLFFMLDLDEYMAMAPNFGMKAEWASRSETHKAKEAAGGKALFLLDNRAIKISMDRAADVKLPKESEFFITGGPFTKIFFDHILPSYTMYSNLYHFQMALEHVLAERVGQENGGECSTPDPTSTEG